MTLPQTMLQARKLQEYLMFLARKMLKLTIKTKVMLLIHKQFSNCLHPYKVCLAKKKIPFYKFIHVGIKGQSLHCNLFLFLFWGLLKHLTNESYLTWPHPTKATNILLMGKWGKPGFLSNPNLLLMSYKMQK